MTTRSSCLTTCYTFHFQCVCCIAVIYHTFQIQMWHSSIVIAVSYHTFGWNIAGLYQPNSKSDQECQLIQRDREIKYQCGLVPTPRALRPTKTCVIVFKPWPRDLDPAPKNLNVWEQNQKSTSRITKDMHWAWINSNFCHKKLLFMNVLRGKHNPLRLLWLFLEFD